VAATLGCLAAATAGPPDYAAERAAMVANQRARGIRDERVLAAMQEVPRHLFVSEANRAHAYDDADVAAGSDQYLCRPYLIALTLQNLELRPDSKVLQVGVGSGYRTALLSRLARHVYAMDFREDVLRAAQARLHKLGHSSNVTWRSGTGCQGWREHSPYDAILVTCATQQVPQDLVDQLREGGRMVIPVGLGPDQTLTRVVKSGGKVRSETIIEARADLKKCQCPVSSPAGGP
jgi:protein-L-isoaspartate(D-aspartate) O-methyltransferase